MRVLLLTPNAPTPEHVNGGATRMHRLYRRLIELGNEVTVVTVFTDDQKRFVPALRRDGFDVIEHIRPRSRLRETCWALARRPALLRDALHRSTKELVSAVFWVDLKPLVRREIARGEFDVVVIESSFAAFWRADIETDLPVVLVTHEVESVHLLAKAARIQGVAGFLRYMNGARVRRSEQEWSTRFDALVVVSRDEERLLQSIVGAGRLSRTYVVGNGADLRPRDQLPADPGELRVLFTGTMAYPPNAVGAEWLARKVWPLVLEEEPRATLSIVGSMPHRSTRALDALPGVSVHADVPDMAPWFAEASVCTLPMLEGGGTRLKLADAFSASRAVVSTTNGATGLDCRHGRELLIADSPDDFAQAIVRLLRDDEQRDRLGRNGRALVERLYDWNNLGVELAECLQDVVARSDTTPIKVVVSDAYA
jgi:glycosyltransferase involved in cell wall biosynthesis